MTTLEKPVPTKKVRDPRNGLRTSATLATVFTLLGHAVFGFEQSVLHVFVALATGYGCTLLFEAIDARANGRPPAFVGGGARGVVDFLLSTHMTAITTSFLLYTNSRFAPLAFAVAAAIGSKYFFRVEVGGRLRHFMNPSNFGVVLTLLLFQYTTAIPWGFTTNLRGAANWILPSVIVLLGLRLNLLFTKRLPLIGSFLLAFVAQGFVRSIVLENSFLAELAPLTNVPLVLFTFYMITDPQTSPTEVRGQVIFGTSIAACYGLFMAGRINWALFFCVATVCAARGLVLVVARVQERRRVPVDASIVVPHGSGVA